MAILGLDLDVACGPGQLPKSHDATGQDPWVSHAVMAPALFGAAMTPDSWGLCFLMNVGARRRGESVWILSAGPNGRVDTPFGATTLEGDDIGVIVK